VAYAGNDHLVLVVRERSLLAADWTSEQTGCFAAAGAPAYTSRGDATSRTRHSPIALREPRGDFSEGAVESGHRATDRLLAPTGGRGCPFDAFVALEEA
jgi:hypothetical protein